MGRWTLVSFLSFVACNGGDTVGRDDPGANGPPGVILVNEVMAENASTLNGPDGRSLPDWVELVNVGPNEVRVDSIRIETDKGSWQGSGGGELLPGERMMVWFDEVRDGRHPWTGFRINRRDDFVLVFVDGHATDQVRVTDLPADVSLARIPDMDGALVPTAWPTPGKPNDKEASPTLDLGDATFFVPHVMHRIEFFMTPDALRAIDRAERPVVHAEAFIDGVYYGDIGLGLKGHASYRQMDEKPAFKVKLDEWTKGTRFRGQRGFNLHNGLVVDPTRTRDHITYSFARHLGLMAPRVGWAEVWANEEYLGLYIVVERYEEEFIEYRRPGEGETGCLYEGNETPTGGWAEDFGGSKDPNFDQEEGPRPPPQGVTDSIFAVHELAKGPPTDENVAALWDWVNKEQFLTYLAWEAVANHTDGYKAANNWRFYVDPNDYRIEWVPTGAEWTWSFDPDIFKTRGRVARLCLDNEGCRREFSEEVLRVADVADSLNLLDDFLDLSAWLDPWIDNDPRFDRSGSWDTVEGARAKTRQRLTTNPENARAQVYATYPDLAP